MKLSEMLEQRKELDRKLKELKEELEEKHPKIQKQLTPKERACRDAKLVANNVAKKCQAGKFVEAKSYLRYLGDLIEKSIKEFPDNDED